MEAREAPEQGCLSAAARSEQKKELTRTDLDANILEDGEIPKLLGDMVNGYGNRHKFLFMDDLRFEDKEGGCLVPPRIFWQSSLECQMGKCLFDSPALLRCDLRKKDSASVCVGEKDAVLSDFNPLPRGNGT